MITYMVAECRFNMTHTTKDHKCGRCGRYGHGLIECRNPIWKDRLRVYHCDIIDEERRCDVPDCDFKQYHTRLAYQCPLNPHRTATSITTNGDETYNVTCPICKASNTLVNPKKIYGISDECCICMDNKVDVLLTTCNHCCVCLECVKK